jgi:hypothetical protein
MQQKRSATYWLTIGEILQGSDHVTDFKPLGAIRSAVLREEETL